MVKHSPGLIRGAIDVLSAAAQDTGTAALATALETLLGTMTVIEEAMESMWSHSKPKDYLSYRTFIFGITNQSMFPHGVIYEGVNDDRPQFYRSESGANDSMIPLLDALLEIPMPPNFLTDILKDFRNYRPKPHRDFLAFVHQRAADVGVRAYCCRDSCTAVLYLRLLDHVRSFRWRHWLFAREYIIRRSGHPTATGGSPIVTWLPNQLFAVMQLMCQVWDSLPSKACPESERRSIEDLMANVHEQYGKLQKEVDQRCQERQVE